MSLRPLARRSRLTTAHHTAQWLTSLVDGLSHWAATLPPRELAERESELLVVTDAYEAWLLLWPPGGVLELHDHGGSSGAFGVVSGVLTESRTRRDAAGPPSVEDLEAGRRRVFGPDDIHDVANRGTRVATSVHVYTPRLASMTFYAPDADGPPVAVRTDVVESARQHHARFGWAWRSAEVFEGQLKQPLHGR